ncbi:MAG: hypothetical protein AAGF24_11985, partial [Cyanobacteria bacterium P01_H01_bin.121]
MTPATSPQQPLSLNAILASPEDVGRPARRRALRVKLAKSRPLRLQILSAFTHKAIVMSLLRLRGWSVVGVATLVLWLWNWPLAIAAASGIAMMAGVYWLQRQSWQAKLQQLQHWLSASHQALVIPPFCGGIAAIGAYLAAMMLAETASPWTVLAVGLEGVGLVCLMAVVLLQWLSRPQANLDDRLDRALTEL